MSTKLDVRGARSDDILALRRLIESSHELRGTKLVNAPAASGQMNAGLLDVLQVILGPGGSATAFAAVLVTWLKTRQTVFSASIETPSGKITLKSHNVDNPDEIMANIARLLQSSAGADAP